MGLFLVKIVLGVLEIFKFHGLVAGDGLLLDQRGLGRPAHATATREIARGHNIDHALRVDWGLDTRLLGFESQAKSFLTNQSWGFRIFNLLNSHSLLALHGSWLIFWKVFFFTLANFSLFGFSLFRFISIWFWDQLFLTFALLNRRFDHRSMSFDNFFIGRFFPIFLLQIINFLFLNAERQLF